MSGHTPGPWFRDGKTIYALNPRNFNRFCAQVQDAHTPDDELSANAVLMQAVPELLAALDGMLSEFNEQMPGIVNDELAVIAKTRAAIRKARGEV